jgi:hypothetical protein
MRTTNPTVTGHCLLEIYARVNQVQETKAELLVYIWLRHYTANRKIACSVPEEVN